MTPEIKELVERKAKETFELLGGGVIWSALSDYGKGKYIKFTKQQIASELRAEIEVYKKVELYENEYSKEINELTAQLEQIKEC